jgi:IS605 OrfB family transposase
MSWRSSDPIVRTQIQPSDIGLPSKLWEWSVNDTIKAILAQQEAAKTFIIRAIYRRAKDDDERTRLLGLMHNDPTSDPWLHRVFRKLFQRGHTLSRNQIVYQRSGYTCKRLTRNTVKLEVQGLEKGKRIALTLKCRHIVSGQIRLIRNEDGRDMVHCTRKRLLILPPGKAVQSIGIDKGYTEAFYTSNGDSVAPGLGALMSQKTKRITRTNRNRYRLGSHAANNPHKAATILKHNLGYKVKSRKLKREKAALQNFIRRDLRRVITAPTRIFAEDLTAPIKGKQQAKQSNRLLNQWMKGELQASIDKIALETGSTVSVVNPAYTSQMCSRTGTLLGHRDGDRFTCYTGDVIQADENAALNILHRGYSCEITRWMKHAEVRTILLMRTIRQPWPTWPWLG